MQNVINHPEASEIICYTAKAFKGQFSLLSGVFEVSWNIRQVSHPGHGCLHWPLSPRASLQLCPICWAQICLFLAQSSTKVTAVTLFPLLCCVQIHGRGWIRTCGRATSDFPAAHLGSEQNTDNKLQRKLSGVF